MCAPTCSCQTRQGLGGVLLDMPTVVRALSERIGCCCLTGTPGPVQEDAHEFLTALLDQVQEEVLLAQVGEMGGGGGA